MKELNGVRLGQPVRDLDGKGLGKVTALHAWGFEVAKGLFLFRRTAVLRYGEIRGVRDGEVVVARSSRDLFELAAGRLPPSWRIPAPPEFPSAATPDEARLLLEDIAAGAIASEAGHAEPLAHAHATPPPSQPAPPLERADERESFEARSAAGLRAPPAPPPHS